MRPAGPTSGGWPIRGSSSRTRRRSSARTWPRRRSTRSICITLSPITTPGKAHLRLVTPRFLADVHKALKPGGLFVIQTDNPDYWAYIARILPVFFHFQEQTTPWPDAPEGRSRREILARSRNLRIFRGEGRRRDDITRDAALTLARSLPTPTFRSRGPWCEWTIGRGDQGEMNRRDRRDRGEREKKRGERNEEQGRERNEREMNRRDRGEGKEKKRREERGREKIRKSGLLPISWSSDKANH